ncbi:cupin-like domain-containing protein [Aurantiacibacter spongiae]|uniref:Cupin-like domain-containing protein n=1 Tax=Aurantiacibacter spongiae TaxID=2488860 RepID=A0A3N5DJM3_9SPHN|nr:cupin-like domain-containing protein [Aurantiacibacter spongiae]RPF70925.1 cupin-like domain-containing protein [Aurantiacibacter spongiae]
MTPVGEISPPDLATFEAEIRPHYRPVVLRGIAADWPIVQAGRESADAALAYLERLDSGAPTEIMMAPPRERGRFFYAPDMRGFNFQKQHGTLSQLAGHLRQIAAEPEPIAIYAGATEAATHLPGFEAVHPFPLLDRATQPTTRVWLGNATQVATHFDLSDNFAVVALGRRRFTLFPPEQTKNLYVGPLNVTLAGQPVSMVDPLAPDTDRYPRFEEAQASAQFAELEPGDAIYIPTLWWHHVAATDPIGILVNYWHNDAVRGGGFLAMVHAMLTIRDQPAPQREAWRAWFDHMVFGEDAQAAADHLPLPARGVNGPPSPQRDEQIRQFLVQVLSSK